MLMPSVDAVSDPREQALSRIQAHRDALGDTASGLLDQGGGEHLFAVVDVAMHAPLLPWLRQNHPGEALSLFEDQPERAFDGLAPRLLDLGPLTRSTEAGTAAFVHETSVGQLTRWHDESPCVSWIYSSASPEHLRDALARQLGGTLYEDDGDDPLGEVMLRFFDARVLGGYLAALDTTQYALAFDGIKAWALWTRRATWNVWTPPEVTPPHLPLLAKSAERFTMAQQQIIADHTVVDRLDARLREHYGARPDANNLAVKINDKLLRRPARERFLALDALVQRARQKGLRSDPDLQLFITFHFSLGPRFHEHDHMQRCFNDMDETSVSFVDAVSTLPDQAWAEISAQASV